MCDIWTIVNVYIMCLLLYVPFMYNLEIIMMEKCDCLCIPILKYGVLCEWFCISLYEYTWSDYLLNTSNWCFFLMNYAFDDLRSYNIYWIIIKCILWMIELWICDESGSCRGWCARWSSLSKQGERIICQGLWSGGVFLYEPVSRVEEGV